MLIVRMPRKKAAKRRTKPAGFIGPLAKGEKRQGGVAGLPQQRVINSSKQVAKHIPSTKKNHTRSLCSILDPFCVHAKGARRPDGSSSSSMPYQVRQIVGIVTNATGKSKYLLVPGFGIYGYASGTLTGTTWAMPAGWTSLGNGAFISTNGAEVRIVSFGVRVISVLPATTASGYAIFGTVPNPAVSSGHEEGRVAYPEHTIRPLTAGMEFCWISKPNGAAAHSFKLVSLVTNNMSDFDWNGLSIEIAGGPNSTLCLMAEMFMNVEFSIKEGDSNLSAVVPPAIPANPVATMAQQVAHSKLPSFIEQPLASATKFLEQKASSVVDDVLSGAMAFLELL
jgi:hypothetical protein